MSSLPIRNPYARSNEPYRSSSSVNERLVRNALAGIPRGKPSAAAARKAPPPNQQIFSVETTPATLPRHPYSYSSAHAHQKPTPVSAAPKKANTPYSAASSSSSAPKSSAQPQSIVSVLDTHDKPLLQELLPKLRPFQREALEFAVTGKRYSRQFAVEGSASSATSSSHHNNYNDDSSLFPSSPNGRILLADEMGVSISMPMMCMHTTNFVHS